MAKRKKNSPLVDVRNALRPFFNSRKSLSRVQQFQSIRQIAPLDQLEQIYGLTEERPHYKFPGLGNTFPASRLKIPDSGLRHLTNLGLLREVRLQMGRLNHHADRLTQALDALADINDAIRDGDWQSADDLVSSWRERFGDAQVMLGKDLLVSFQNSGLGGLSRRYKQVIEDGDRSAWALLAHITYDLLDPAFSPERGSRMWLRALVPRQGAGYYAAPAISELLTRWPTQKALAESLLRYGGVSLVDLALCFWKAIAVHSDWPEVQTARELLHPTLADVLERRFNASSLTVPGRYHLDAEGPPDIDVFRASFFFQENAPIARWRATLSTALYPEYAGRPERPPFLLTLDDAQPSVNEDREDEPSRMPEGHNITSAMEEILTPGIKISSAKFIVAVVVSDFIRRYDGSESLQPEKLADLLAGVSTIHEHVGQEAFERLLVMEHLASSKFLTFVLRDRLFRSNRTRDAELDRRAAFMDMFSVGGRNEIVPFLETLRQRSRKTAKFVATLCTRSFLERLYLLVESVQEVVETRIEICNWLLEHYDGNSETTLEERDALERELANLDARSDLDSTRVHVDEESLREWYNDTQRSLDIRYKQTVLAEGADSAHGTFLDFYNKTRELPKASDEGDDLIADTQIGSEFTLLTIFEATLRAFVNDKTFGLDSYLSRRIRHGTLRGFLTTPIARVRRRLAEEIDREERQAERENLEFVASRLDVWLAQFAEAVDFLRREIIQIRSEQHPSGLIEATWRTPTNVRHLDAMMARTRARVIESRGDYDIFSDVYLLCWDFLERDLAQLRLHLIREFAREMSSFLGVLHEEFDYDQKMASNVYWHEVHNLLNSRIQEICGWFIRPVFRRDAYDLKTLVESTVSIVRELDDAYQFEDNVDISQAVSINRGSFDVLGDMLFVLIGNAAKHGKRDGKLQISASRIINDNNLVQVCVRSEVESIKDLREAELRINQAIDASDFENIKSAGVIEGFSGIRKILGLIYRVRNPSTSFTTDCDEAQLAITCTLQIPSMIAFARERT